MGPRKIGMISLACLLAGCGGGGSGSAPAASGGTPPPLAAVTYARNVWVLNQGSGSTSLFSVAPTGALVSRGSVPLGGGAPNAVALGPYGVYMADQGANTLSVVLRPMTAPQPFGAVGPTVAQVVSLGSGTTPVALLATATDLYVALSGTHMLQDYAIAPGTHLLGTATGVTVSAGAPASLALAGGHFVYTLAGGEILTYAAASGNLGPGPVASLAAPSGTTALVANASGTVLYAVSSQGTETYAVSSGSGALTLVPTYPSPPLLAGLAVSPVVNQIGGGRAYGIRPGGGEVDAYTVAQNGTLTMAPSNPTYGYAATQPTAVTIDPGGHFLYVTQGNNEVSVWAIHNQDGSLTFINRWRTGVNPVAVAVSEGAQPVALTPTSVVTGGSALQGFTVDPATGFASTEGSTAFPGGSPFTSALLVRAGACGGPLAYATLNGTSSGNAGQAFAFSVTAPWTGSAVTTLPSTYGPTSMALDPNQHYLFVPDNGDDAIDVFDVSGVSPGAGPVQDTSVPIPNPYAQDSYPVVMDPTGRFLYLSNVFAHVTDAFAVQGPHLSNLGAQQVIGASELYLSPTGRWLYMFGQNPEALFVYGIDSTTGLLSLLPNEPTAGYTLPISSDGFLVDPLGRFVWLTSTASGTETLYTWTIDPATGLLTPQPTTPAPSPGNGFLEIPAIDPSGTYLYTTSPYGGLDFYRIGADGSFTELGSATNSPGVTGDGQFVVVHAPCT